MTQVGLVSVIVPVHNAEGYLAHAHAQLAPLSGPSVEFIIIDDHSTDGTSAGISSWAFGDSGVTIASSSQRGVAHTRNEAVALASGEYLWFADCDDEWSGDIVRKLHARAVADDADIVVCNAQKVLDDGTPLEAIVDAPGDTTITGAESLGRLLRGEIQGHLWNKLFRRSLFTDAVFPATRAHSDLGGMFSLLTRARRVSLLNASLYTYKIHAGSILNQRQYRWEDLEDCLALAEKSVGSTDASLKADLRRFRYRNVVIPLQNESIRREGWGDAAEIDRVRRRNRRRVSVSDVAQLSTHGEAAVAARAALIAWAPSVYRLIYRRHRQRRWSGVDAANAST
ncbi:glycosyltransferase family 2 protein [Compostimonas suwonensis]|uniref:Glycosyltransferase involved in cell wall biosynthesis n=1 Tax=Compostimonas suwonensis TaxID=1048394 RepID=A0A2M9BC91_9MICO|nr:glycosyltransferase [Compostimonas suwonensis]PJJ55557.1 glycosyltransferase involved in cell wall biosynthesis [Compostimonas suwonensis]